MTAASDVDALAGASRLRTRGHPAALAYVKSAILSGRAPNALLLEGPAGIGKATLARDLAAGLLCQAADPTARPCRTCPSCHKVDHGNHPDLHVLRPEGAGDQIRLGQVQRLAADLALMAMEGTLRLAIIEGAHRLNPDAQNALLKTLEEPVGPTCIVLVVDDPATILPTVASRAERLRMGPVPAAVIADLLVEAGICDEPAAAVAARAARGRVGAAVAIATDPDATLVAGRLARGLLDLAAAPAGARLGRVPELLADGALLEGVGRGARPAPQERRRAALRVLLVWRDLARDLAIVAHGGAAQIADHTLLEDLRCAAPRMPKNELLAFLEKLDGLIAAVEEYANPELALDSVVLAWPRLRTAA